MSDIETRYILTKLSSGYLASSTYSTALGISGITTIGTRQIMTIEILRRPLRDLRKICETLFSQSFNEAPYILLIFN
tara:strand:+ start:49 stop:279 length:231 start_codon:yes stop_codon:yes gene_type:complete